MEEEQGLVGNLRKDTARSPGGKSPKKDFLRHKTLTFRKTYDVKILVFCVFYITKFVKAHLNSIQRFWIFCLASNVLRTVNLSTKQY